MRNDQPARICFVAIVAILVSFNLAARAAAPMVKTSAPGFYRMMLGDFEITALSDGTASLPMGSLLTNTTPAKVKKAFARSFIKDPVETSVNAYLVNTGAKLVMIDAGAGNLFGPTLGNSSGGVPEKGVCRCRAAGLLGRRRASAVSRDRTSAGGRQGLCLRSGQLFCRALERPPATEADSVRPPERPRSVGNLAHLGPRGSGALVHALALTCWIGLLLLPNVTTVAFANAWVTDPRHLVAVSIWVVVALWAMLPRRWFLVLTYPVIVAGAVVLAADVQRSVNLFDLIAVWHTFTHGEVINAVRPYLGPFCFFALALLVPLTILWRGGTAQGLSRTGRLGVAGSGVLLVLALPQRAWLESWPVALLPAPFEAQAAGIGILLSPIANIRISPRDRKQSWNATRKHAPAVNETYVLVIGESVRSDRLNGCGGRAEVTAPPRGSLLYCDVLAGSSGTETSVPLLVSRELPGHYERVSRDATVVKAFEEAGFETFWISTHVRAIAWPDAQNQVYDAQPATDRAALLPLLDQALARPAARKLIVLHAYNSHSPYAERYAAATAPFAVDPRIVQAKLPTAANLDTWWNAYDNAIDESMRLLDAVVARLRTERGQAFFMFTPDHGENMLDDHRQLLEHALKFPTLWDTRVPAIVWANSDWQLAHRDKWRTLAANREQPLMHMDVAPTLLGAAGIDYDDERALPVDLTTRIAGERVRVTQARAGETVTADALVRQARAPANADVLARLAQVAEN